MQYTRWQAQLLRYALRHSESLQVHKDWFKTDPFAIIIAPLGGTNIARMSSRPELLGGGMGTDRSRPMWTRWIQIWSLFTTNVKAVRDTCVAAVHGASLCAIWSESAEPESGIHHVKRCAKGAVRREKKSSDDMHAGMNARVLSDSRTQLSSARIRTRLREGRGEGMCIVTY